MANVIKHKRGSGSDPVASDLVVGEVAIRTDVGKLFTKMDNGSVAEIAGGGSDIAINTLSSSSATGGGSATFNGSAYRFTLSAPPSVSAQQLLVSINGVIQKPVAGTGQPSEGFSVDGTDIILGDAPATGSDFFILTFKSLGVSEPADNSVTSAKIADGAIVNADINASAAIAGTKISPDFGSQDITTTGDLTISGGDFILNGTYPNIRLIDTNNDSDYRIANANGDFQIYDISNSATRFAINGNTGNIGLGTENPDRTIHCHNSSNTTNVRAKFSNGTTGEGASDGFEIGINGSDPAQAVLVNNENSPMAFFTNASERMRIDSSGNVAIGNTNPQQLLHVWPDTANTSSAFIRVSSGDRGSGTGIDLGSDSDGDGRINVVSNANLKLYTNDTERVHISSDGKVGLGTSSPTRPLHIESDEDLTSFTGTAKGAFCISNSDYDNNEFSAIDFTYTGFANHNPIARIATKITSNGTFLSFGTSDSYASGITNEALTIHYNANIGIGITSPNVTLHQHVDDSGSNYHQFTNSACGTAFGDGSLIGIDGGEDLLVWNQEVNAIKLGTSNTERMRITSSGGVNVGNGVLSSNSNDGNIVVDEGIYIGTFNGNNQIRSNSAGGGSATLFIGNQSIQTSSDRRIKQNIVDTEINALSKLEKVKVVDFNWNDPSDKAINNKNARGKWTGCIAQEIVDIFPHVVNAPRPEGKEIDYNSEDLWTIQYEHLVPVLIKAIQELTAKVKALEAK